MSDPATRAQAAGEYTSMGTCPSCGQSLLSEEAVRHLEESELERRRQLEARLKALVPELADELLAKLRAEYAERLQGEPGAGDLAPAALSTDYAKDSDVLRGFFRQF